MDRLFPFRYQIVITSLTPQGTSILTFATNAEQFVVIPPPNISFGNVNSNNLTLQIANATQPLTITRPVRITNAPSSRFITNDPSIRIFPDTFDATNFGCAWYYFDGQRPHFDNRNNLFFRIQNANASNPTITFQPGSDVGRGPRNFFFPFPILQRAPITFQLTAITEFPSDGPATRTFRFVEDRSQYVLPTSQFKIALQSNQNYTYYMFDYVVNTYQVVFNVHHTQYLQNVITFAANGVANGILVNNVYQPC